MLFRIGTLSYDETLTGRRARTKTCEIGGFSSPINRGPNAAGIAPIEEVHHEACRTTPRQVVERCRRQPRQSLVATSLEEDEVRALPRRVRRWQATPTPRPNLAPPGCMTMQSLVFKSTSSDQVEDVTKY